MPSLPSRGNFHARTIFHRVLSCLTLAVLAVDGLGSDAVPNLGATLVHAQDGNRLTYLDESDPYYVSRVFPKLATPQWVGEPGVEAVIVLAIDDMRGHEKWEQYLRPILERLKQIDGRAPVSIMTCQIDPREQHLQTWLKEGLSLEIHTVDHPQPLLKSGDLEAARSTYDRCIDMLFEVPGNTPVAFRMPYCDSLNSNSPRFYAEIFNRVTPEGHFLAIDSSVFQLFTSNDPELPRGLVLDPDGRDRFLKYLPADRAFVNTLDDYPYPYVIGARCWEFPCIMPSDWEAQHLNQPNNPRSVEDLKAALDATVSKQGVFNFVFHPHGWIRADQVIEMIDHVVEKYGPRVKFLTFREAYQRLTEHLLAGQALRDPRGEDHGVRLLDLNQDGWLDVVIGNADLRQTRLWQPSTSRWRTLDFPIHLVATDQDQTPRETGARFGIVGDRRQVLLLARDESVAGAWRFDGQAWREEPQWLDGLEIEGKPVETVHAGQSQGLRLIDLDGDGSCECILANPRQHGMWRWDDATERWQATNAQLPAGIMNVDETGGDAGLRFVDLDEDGLLDLLFSNGERSAIHLFLSLEKGWTAALTDAQGEAIRLPPIAVAGSNYGVWFSRRHLWAQNEATDRLPDLIDRRSFNDLLGNVRPGPKSARASLACIRTRPGFQVELMASEPLVMDPVAFAWGPDGRLWVAEMADYPLGMHGPKNDDAPTDGAQGEAGGGRVRYLEDTDGDGKYDRSTLFLEGLNFPNGVLPWGKGVLVTAAPDILYAEDTDGDGKADARRVIYTGFGEGNQQHRVNGLQYGLDNWVHCANGDSGGEILCVATGERFNIGGRDLRIRPDENLLDPETGPTQFLRSQDDWGNWFGSNNANPMYHFVHADAMLRRNWHVSVQQARVNVSQVPGASPVFPLSRTQARFNDPNAYNRFTSACSSILYRDELFGPAFVGNSFVSEPVHNLVHREVVSPAGVTFTSRRAEDESQSEFLASSDNWFRPTMLRVGPDGALWIADMYRAVIEHPEYIPKELQADLDLRGGDDRGRIYRVYPVGVPPRAIPRLDQTDAVELAMALDSPSGWQRDLAQQLLVERSDPESVATLRQLALDPTRRPQTRLHALCSLDGMVQLDEQTLVAALADPHAAVRRQAARLSELRLDASEKLASAVRELASDADLTVCMQAAYSLGEWHDPQAGKFLGRLAVDHSSETFVVEAVLSSLNDMNLPAVMEVVLSSQAEGTPRVELIQTLLAMAGALESTESLERGLRALVRTDDGRFHDWQLAGLAGFLDSLDRRGSSLAQFVADADPNLKPSLDRLVGAMETARELARDEHTEQATRLLALALLGRTEAGRELDLVTLQSLLVPSASNELQQASIRALSAIDDPRVADALLDEWQGYTPPLRGLVLDALLARRAWTLTLLDTMRAGSVLASELDATRRQRLVDHADDLVRSRASRLLGSSQSSNRAKILEQFRGVMTLAGDMEHGLAVFKKTCAGCHRLDEVGHAVGPDLSALTDRSPQALLVAVLDPSRAVESKFLSYTAVTRDGLTYSGLLAGETSNSITLLAAEGKETRILREDLESLVGSKKSLMPDGIEKDLTQQDLADVFAWLRAKKPPRKVFEGNQPALVRPEAFRGELWLLATTAEIYGNTLVFEPHYSNLGYWASDNDHAVWSIEIQQAGTYSVALEYACADETAGGSFEISVDGEVLQGTVAGTGNWDTYTTVQVGELKLTKGRHGVVMRPAQTPRGAMIDLKGIRLRPKRKS